MTLTRLDPQLRDEMEEIMSLRKEKNLKKISFRKISQLISRHKFWQQTKIDIVNHIDRS